MDWTLIGLFLLATFFGGLTSGLTGFAAGLVVSGVWLHILTPLQTAMLIASYGMVNQGYGIWKVRHALNWQRILPFVIGGAIRVPLGVHLVTYLNPAHLRIGVGILLSPTAATIWHGQVWHRSRPTHGWTSGSASSTGCWAASPDLAV
jgi:uncharacterized protein